MARDTTTTASSAGQDVKPMNALIAAEKAVLLSLQKLSVDYTKAAEALSNWGKSEKEDLGCVITASTTLLNHFSVALSQYVAHGHTMQRQLETMSKRGDSLDSLKQKRNSTHSKAEETANQLSKMDPENKYFSMHTEALKRLRKDVRKMDTDIKAEDAAFGDFKRTATKVWMNLKFGGLQDCCDKGSIAGKFGKLAAIELSEETTQPGVPRRPHSPTNVDNFVAEADRHVNAVGRSSGSVRSRESTQDNQESSISTTSSYFPPQRELSTLAPQLPPKPSSHHNSLNYHQITQPGEFGEGPDSFQSSSGHRSHAPPHQHQLPQGTSGYPSQDRSQVGRRGTSNSTSSNCQGSSAQTRLPDSGGYTLSPTSLSGRPSFSEKVSHVQPNRPSGSSHSEGYALQDSRSLGGHSSFSAGSSSHWQNPPSDRFPPAPAIMRPPPPPTESSRYALQDPSSSLGGRHDSAGPSHWQHPSNPFPVPSRPHASSEPGRYTQDSRYAPSDSGSSHWQGSPSDRLSIPPLPPGSSDSGGHLQDSAPLRARNGDSTFPEGKAQWENPPPPPPPVHRYPDPSSSGGPHRDPSFAAGPSRSSNSVSAVPPRPPLPPPGVSSKSQMQGSVLTASSSVSRGYSLQDPGYLGGQRYHQSGSDPSSMAGPSHWASTNSLPAGSGSTVNSAGTMTRAREGYSHPMNSWGGPSPSSPDADDVDESPPPPAYMLENQESFPDSAGHLSVPPAPGPNSNSPGRWERRGH